MSVLRNLNVLSQMRLDVPHMRLVDSSVAGDFDTIVGRAVAGGKALVVKGFTVSGSTGSQANTLQLNVADGIVYNLNASESGSFLWVESTRANEVLDGATNGNVTGAFVSSTVNYVGLDFVRTPDDTTTDLVKFKDPVTGTETDLLVPLGKTLNYRISISVAPFSTQDNIIPLAIVTVDSTGTATAIQDARNMMYRLGSGGDSPSSTFSYSWPQGRVEGSFSGGDKSITSQKDWSDALMSRIWEIGGGASWFSAVADRNVHMTTFGSPFSNGEYWTFDSGTGAVSWQGIRLLFDGGTGLATKNEIDSGSGTILDGQCVYVDLDRSTNRLAGVNAIVPAIASLTNLGTGSVPGSRWVLAWRVGTSLFTRDWRYPVGTTFAPATTSSLGVVQLNATPANSLAPQVVTIKADGKASLTTVAAAGNAGFVVSVSGSIASGTGPNGINSTGTKSIAGTSGIGVFGDGGATETGTGGAGLVGFGGSDEGFGGTGGAGVVGVGGDGLTASGVGVHGTGGGTGAAGVVGIGGGGNAMGVQGTATGTGAGVHGISGTNGHGLRGEGNGATAIAVYGNATVAGAKAGVFVGSSNTNAVESTASGTGIAVVGVSSNSTGSWGVKGDTTSGGSGGVLGEGSGSAPGVKGVSGTSGAGVVGEADGGGSTVGVSGDGGFSGDGGSFTSNNGDAVVGSAGGTGRAFHAVLGNIGIANTNQVEYTAVKTGYLFVPVTDLQKVSGSAALTVAGGTINKAHYYVDNSVTARLLGSIRLPRGAEITGVAAHARNSGFASYTLPAPNIKRYVYNTSSTAMNVTTILSGAGSVNFGIGEVGFKSYGSITSAPVGDGWSLGNSGVVEVDWQLGNATSDGAQVAGLLITYTYTILDFMV